MSQAPIYWANKLTQRQQNTFWHLITEWGFSGETAYCRTLAGATIYRRV
jgi:hypothetical protein